MPSSSIYLKHLRDPEVVIRQLSEQLSLSMYEVLGLLRLDDKVPVAAWAYDQRDDNEVILLNRQLVSIMADDELLEIVKHEVLHRSAYGQDYDFPDRRIGNIALDAVINRILYLSNPNLTIRWCRRIYADIPPDSPITLARADVQRGDVPDHLKPTWDAIWNSTSLPSPYLVYFAIAHELESSGGNGGGQFGPNDDDGSGGGSGGIPHFVPLKGSWDGDDGIDDEPPAPRQPLSSGQDTPSADEQKDESDTDKKKKKDKDKQNDKPTQVSMFDESSDDELKLNEDLIPIEERPRPVRKSSRYRVRQKPENPTREQVADRGKETATEIFDQIQRNGHRGIEFSETFSNLFETLEIIPKPTAKDAVEDFLASIRVKEEADDVATRLMAAFGTQPQVSVIPLNLTATGVMMAGVGVSDATGIYWTETPYEQRAKARIYVDTSPSMADWRDRCVYIINCIKDEIPAEMYAFAGNVTPIETEDFAAGKYPAGHTTYFDAVMQDILGAEESLAIIFTDGESSVSPENKALIHNSNKQIYTVLLGSLGDQYYNGADLRELSVDTASLLEKGQMK